MNPEKQNNERNEENSLDQLRSQAHILEAFRIVIRDRKIAETIRKHFDYNSARTHFVARFNLDKVQAESILNMSLEDLHSLTDEEIERQFNELMSRISELEEKESAIVSSENK